MESCPLVHQWSMIKPILAALLLLYTSILSAQETPLVKKLNQSAIPLNAQLLPAGAGSPALLKHLNSFKALGLGEATHGTHEFFLAKAALIGGLLKTRHFDRIGLEAPYAEVENLNAWILHEEGNLDSILKSFRQYTYETGEFADFVSAVKKHNATSASPVLFYGYDFQSPYTSLGNLRKVLKNRETRTAADTLLSIFRELSNALYAHEIDQGTYGVIMLNSRKIFTELENDKRKGVADNLKNYRQFLLLNDPASSNGDLLKASRIRDSLMAQNVSEQIRRGHSMLVWAHNGHVQKSANVYSKSMGQFLSEMLGSGYAAVGLTTFRGFYTGYNNTEQGVVKNNPLTVPQPTAIEYFLYRAKYQNYIVATAGLPVPPDVDSHRFLGYGVTDKQFQPGRMEKEFDYILFISATTGSLNFYLKKPD